MTAFEYYKLNVPQVIHEVIDGEAVLVNMENGFYYSLDDAGADIWNLIEKGHSSSQIETILLRNYEGPPAEIKAGLKDLIQSLHNEELIIGIDPPQNDAAPETYQAEEISKKKIFNKPTLQKYTDMEDLLLLDPIHDVDEDAGWPKKTAGN